MTRRLHRAALALGATLALPLSGQSHEAHPPPDSAVQAFLSTARAATARYGDQRQAVADGYRRLGPDFPGMGEHWVNPRLILGGRVDAAHPQVLAYAAIGGTPTLVGVAYAVPLAAGESPPTFPTPEAWHDHSGTLDAESVLLQHNPAGHGDGAALRLAMLHAWVWLENPGGTFQSENWVLPYLRLGLAAPASAPPAAARALSLASGGASYYSQLLHALARPGGDPGLTQAGAALDRAAARVRAWLAGREGGAPLAPGELDTLAGLWVDLGREIDGALAPAVRERLRPLWSVP